MAHLPARGSQSPDTSFTVHHARFLFQCPRYKVLSEEFIVHNSQATFDSSRITDHLYVQGSGQQIFYASNKAFNNHSQGRRSKFQPFPNPKLSHTQTSIEQKQSDTVYKPFPQQEVTVRNLQFVVATSQNLMQPKRKLTLCGQPIPQIGERATTGNQNELQLFTSDSLRPKNAYSAGATKNTRSSFPLLVDTLYFVTDIRRLSQT